MNKLFSKVAALSVGLAMAIGVGVAVGSRSAKVVRAAEDDTHLFNDVAFSQSLNNGATLDDVTIDEQEYYVKTISVKVRYNKTAGGVGITPSIGGDALEEKVYNTSTSSGVYNDLEWEVSPAVKGEIVFSFENKCASGTGKGTFEFVSVTLTEGPGGGPVVTYTISYNSNGGSGTMSDSTGSNPSVAECAFTAPEGKQFQKWNTAANGSGADHAVGSKPKADLTLYAIWEEKSESHAGTAEDPFTVAEALAKCAEIGTVGKTGQGPWVTTGIISRVTEAPVATYWNATYYISDDGSQTNELQVYRGFYLDNAKFDAETAQLMKAGMIVTVTGNLTGSYGSEYCQGNYLLSIESPSTGDVDVVFEPTTSFEIGATGTFTASSETSGVVFSWEVEDSSILSVNASSGAYEALALGVTKVTVTATAGGKEGSASAYITVNGASYMTVNAANELAATVPTGQTTGYYVYVEGFVSAFDVDSQTRALNITSKGEDSTIMVFVGKSGYSAFIDGLQVGMCLRVKANVQNYNGTYELTSPVKMYTEYVAMTFAREFLDSTDAICEGYDGVSSNKAALEAIWSGFETKYDSLSDVQKNTLMEPTTYGAGNTVKDAMERYDYLTGKYELDNFITGRTPVQFVHVGIGLNDVASDNNTMIIVVVIAAVSALAFTTLLVFKKKKQK